MKKYLFFLIFINFNNFFCANVSKSEKEKILKKKEQIILTWYNRCVKDLSRDEMLIVIHVLNKNWTTNNEIMDAKIKKAYKEADSAFTLWERGLQKLNKLNGYDSPADGDESDDEKTSVCDPVIRLFLSDFSDFVQQKVDEAKLKEQKS